MFNINTINDTVVNYEKILRRSLSFFERTDEIDLAIVEKLEEQSPENILALARVLRIPKSTVYRRIEKLLNMGLTVEPIIDYNKLDLKCGVALINPKEGYLSRIYNLIVNIHWFHRIIIASGDFIIAKFFVPRKYENIIDNILYTLKKEKIIKFYRIMHTSIDLASGKINREYMSVESKILKFPWSKWYRKIVSEETIKGHKLINEYLKDRRCALLADEVDVKIIEQLQKNAFKKKTEIARTLNIPPWSVRHHFKTHIVKRNIILKYTPRILLFHPDMVEYLMGTIKFHSVASMKRFVNVLWNSPILRRVSKLVNLNNVFVSIMIPKDEVRNLYLFLDRLCEVGILRGFRLYNVYLKTFSCWSIPSELFKETYWDIGMEKIKKAIEETLNGKIASHVSYYMSLKMLAPYPVLYS